MEGTKDKADELMDYYYTIVEFDLDRDKQIRLAKKGAVKAVDLVKDELKKHFPPTSDELEFWYEVERYIWEFKR